MVLHYNHHKSIYRVSGDVWLVFPAKQMLYSLRYIMNQWKIIFQKFERTQTHLLMCFSSIRNMVVFIIMTQYICGVTSDTCLLFPAKPLLYSLSICSWSMINHFLEIKRHKIHLLVNCSSIRNSDGSSL